MLLLAIVLIIIGIALIAAPHYGGPPPLALVGWVCLIIGIILLVFALLRSSDVSLDVLIPAGFIGGKLLGDHRRAAKLLAARGDVTGP